MLAFDINWEEVQWSEMNKPLYSAHAAQLVLITAQGRMSSDTDMMAQAIFWRENYNANGILVDLINAANRLEVLY